MLGISGSPGSVRLWTAFRAHLPHYQQHEVILIMTSMISEQLIRDISGVRAMELSGGNGPCILVAVTRRPGSRNLWDTFRRRRGRHDTLVCSYKGCIV